MLYIEDSDGRWWLTVVDVLSEREDCDMVLCLYPDSEPNTFPGPFSLPRAPEALEHVTTDADEGELPRSARIRVSVELIDALRSHIGDFEEWGDSLALYPPRARAWTAAFIPHERVVIVRDVRLRDFLDAAGIPVRLEPPEGRGHLTDTSR